MAMETAIRGLSWEEAEARRRRGEGNDVRLPTSRSYGDIIRQNVFAFINIILFTIGLILALIGRVDDAVTSVVLILMNISLGVYQEIRAKRQLDRIALLTRPKVNVIRDGEERIIDPSEIVLGDILVARRGDQIVVDGVIVGETKMEVDESLLTGESDQVLKGKGDEVLSGSFCVSGTGVYQAKEVGVQSYANRISAGARAFRVTQTPLQKDVDFIIRILTLLAIFIGLLLLISSILLAIPLVRSVQMAAVIAGLVPNGLFLMLIVAYAMGALRIVGRGALVQQSNSIESLSYVNVLCMDKTGTLTANKIHFHEMIPIGIRKEELKDVVGDFAHSASVVNRTTEALLETIDGNKREMIAEVPFSSERKWSALAFASEAGIDAYFLGAPEIIQPYLQKPFEMPKEAEQWLEAGLRVLLFAQGSNDLSLYDEGQKPRLPSTLVPLGLLSFSDELRPAVYETLEGFNKAGIQLKVISGDNPQTVASLARQAHLPGDLDAIVSGPELEQMDDAQFGQAAAERTIFGRISPTQKEKLVDVLRTHGYYVAMIGDGVNDVLSLKKANLGIAMQGGSAATRGVADMVLLNDSFSALPPAFLEGQRIVNGMMDILRLFLTRATYFALLIIATSVIGIGFPYVPKHATLVMLFTVGIPTFALAAWARPGPVPRLSLIRSVTHFVFPAAFSTFIFGLLVYVIGFGLTFNAIIEGPPGEVAQAIEPFQEYVLVEREDLSVEAEATEVAILVAQTSLTFFTLFAGLVLVIYVEPPTEFFAGGDVVGGDLRPTILTVGLFFGFIIAMLIDPIRHFFEILPLPPLAYLGIGGTVIIWALVLRLVWREEWLERFLGLDREGRRIVEGRPRF
jgi:cation-transporting ATPase E